MTPRQFTKNYNTQKEIIYMSVLCCLIYLQLSIYVTQTRIVKFKLKNVDILQM